jgi:hypothetical protein
VENIQQNTEDSVKNLPIEEESPVIVENNLQKQQTEPNLKWEEYMHPEFPWRNRKLWINNPKAVNYWLSTKGGNVRDLSRFRNEEENIKKY